MLASGLAELVSLGAVLPFLGVLSDPELLWQQPFIKEYAIQIGLTNPSQLLLPVTFVFTLVVVFGAFIRLTNLWLNGRLAAAIGSDLSCEAYRRTLYQPYEVHLQLNSAAVITSITTHINRTIAAISAFLQMITALVVSLGLLTGLLLIDWTIALSVSVLFGSVYYLLAVTARRELRINSQLISETAKQQIKALQEGLGAIRDVLLDGNQGLYVDIYREADVPQRKKQVRNQFLGIFPRYAVEALGLVSIALLGGLLVYQQGSDAAVIPLLGAIALGAQRLLPALQQVYSGWSRLKSFNADLAGVLALLNQPLPPSEVASEALQFFDSIRFDSVYFGYGPGQKDVIGGGDLEIRCGERIALIGSTGSGKSTTVDLLMGLLKPNAGRILIDGNDLHDPSHPERLSAWRLSIAHVPQSIYLADSTIAENIAFGLPHHMIDMELLKIAAEQAQIARFIESMPSGYSSFVGERGIRLSGGQRQRIGIARALYKQAKVVVLDEATSALDISTEDAVIKAVESLSRDLTIIMIAHRLSTIEHCDRVIRLERGVLNEPSQRK